MEKLPFRCHMASWCIWLRYAKAEYLPFVPTHFTLFHSYLPPGQIFSRCCCSCCIISSIILKPLKRGVGCTLLMAVIIRLIGDLIKDWLISNTHPTVFTCRISMGSQQDPVLRDFIAAVSFTPEHHSKQESLSDPLSWLQIQATICACTIYIDVASWYLRRQIFFLISKNKPCKSSKPQTNIYYTKYTVILPVK